MEGRARGSWGCSSDPPVPLPWLRELGEDQGGASSGSGCRQLSFCRNWAHSEELPGLLPVIWWEAFPPRKPEARNPIALSSPSPLSPNLSSPSASVLETALGLPGMCRFWTLHGHRPYFCLPPPTHCPGPGTPTPTSALKSSAE